MNTTGKMEKVMPLKKELNRRLVEKMIR